MGFGVAVGVMDDAEAVLEGPDQASGVVGVLCDGADDFFLHCETAVGVCNDFGGGDFAHAQAGNRIGHGDRPLDVIRRHGCGDEGRVVQMEYNPIHRPIICGQGIDVDPLVILHHVLPAVFRGRELDGGRCVVDGDGNCILANIAAVFDDAQPEAVSAIEPGCVPEFEHAPIDLIVVIWPDLLPVGGLQALAEVQLVKAEIATAGVAENLEATTDVTEGRRLSDGYFLIGEHGSVCVVVFARRHIHATPLRLLGHPVGGHGGVHAVNPAFDQFRWGVGRRQFAVFAVNLENLINVVIVGGFGAGDKEFGAAAATQIGGQFPAFGTDDLPHHAFGLFPLFNWQAFMRIFHDVVENG